ncbi:MAG TPA: Spy/CpxP family protein refolding chaperone [Caulobacteraceae bacterium]
MTDPIPDSAPAAPKPRRLGVGLRRVALGAAFAATFFAGGLVMSGPSAAALGMAMDHAGMGAHGGMHAMAGAHIEKMLTQVGATPDQKARIETILHTAFASMAPMHAKMADTHRDLARLLTAPVIDRGALEELRASRLADFDRASRAIVGGMADAAEVLTPEQRARLAAAMAERRPNP